MERLFCGDSLKLVPLKRKFTTDYLGHNQILHVYSPRGASYFYFTLSASARFYTVMQFSFLN